MKPERNIISVSDFVRIARHTIENAFAGGLWVAGEVRQFKAHSSGHWYFALRDNAAQVDCVMWHSDNMALGWQPEDGVEIEAHIFPTVFERAGRFQAVVKKMTPGGKGARAIAFEMLKKKLAAMGLFDQFHKKKMPAFPLTIGIITSRTGAAIRDICNIVRRRAPWITLILRDTRVQGEDAPADIVAAIEEFNKFGTVDLLIVGRGGGSEEDLWCFNDERVAMAIYNSQLPIISAVGHEIDFTIADFVADLRAPTPSAAAEVAAPDRTALINALATYLKRVSSALTAKSLHERNKLQQLSHTLALASPKYRIDESRQKIDLLLSGTYRNIALLLERKRTRLTHIGEILKMLSPKKVLARGFAIVRRDGNVIRASNQLAKRNIVEIEFSHGGALAIIDELHHEEPQENHPTQ